MKPPFFIVGTQRSGTTLLSKMLARHPDIFMEDQAKSFRLIGAFDNMYDLLPHNADISREDFIRWMLYNDKNERIREVVDESLISREVNVRQLINSSLEQKCIKASKSIWGDKAPNLQHYINHLLLYIPAARFIHIVRDGRATVASMKKRSYRNPLLSADLWVNGNSQGLVNQIILGESHYLIIRYEDLLINAEQIMRRICTFLSLDYNKEVLDLSSQGLPGDSNYVKSFLDTSKIESWKSELSAKEVEKVEAVQQEMLARLGYEVDSDLSHKPLKFRKKVRLTMADNWKALWRRKKKGMKDWQVVEYEDSFRKRLGRFAVDTSDLLLSRSLHKSFFPSFFYKEAKKSR